VKVTLLSALRNVFCIVPSGILRCGIIAQVPPSFSLVLNWTCEKTRRPLKSLRTRS